MSCEDLVGIMNKETKIRKIRNTFVMAPGKLFSYPSVDIVIMIENI